jgi:hypothetical protein
VRASLAWLLAVGWRVLDAEAPRDADARRAASGDVKTSKARHGRGLKA